MAVSKNNPLHRVGVVVLWLANLAALVSMVQSRIVRVNRTDASAFVSASYVILLLGVLLGVVLISMLLWRGVVQAWCERYPLAMALFIPLSLVAVLLVPPVLQIPNEHFAALVIWVVLLDIGLSMMLVALHGERLRLQAVMRGLGIAALWLVIPLVALEGGLRVYFLFFGTQADRIAYVYSVDYALELTNRYVGRPYINYGLSPNYQGHNSRGYRGDALETPKQPSTYRIFALGGSTTYGSSLDAFAAYPAQLARVLHEDYGYTHVEVVNAGVEAYSSYDSLANLTYKVLDDAPDMLIIYHAVNDVNARLVAPAAYSGLNAVRGVWSPELIRRVVSPSTLVRYLSINLGYGANLNNAQVALFSQEASQRCDISIDCANIGMSGVDLLEANPPIYFERNLRNLVAIARANDVDVVFSTWTYFPDRIEDVANIMAYDFYRVGVAEHNAVLRRLADELDVPLVDLADVMDADNRDYWLDTMHMSLDGTVFQAETYAAFLVGQGLLPPLE